MARHPETKANRQPNNLLKNARVALPSRWDPRHPMSRAEFADEINNALVRLYPDQAAKKKSRIATFFVNPYWVGVMERGERRSTSNERRAAVREVTGKNHDRELGLYPQRPRDTDTPPTELALSHTAELEPPSQPTRTHDASAGAGAASRGRSDRDQSAINPMPVGLEFDPDMARSVTLVAHLWKADQNGKDRLHETGFDAAAFSVPALRWLTSSLDGDVSSRGERVVGIPDIEMVRQITATYRNLDNKFGGGHVRGSVVRFLAGDITDLIAGRYDNATGKSLLAAASETAQLAAWASYDAGMHGLAQRHLIQALRLAAGAADKALGAEILAAMSHQAAYLEAPAVAIDLARAAGRTAEDAGVAAIRAECAVLEAQGHAVGGDEAACATALDFAEKLFDQADRDGDPKWMGYFDEAYLAAKFGQCFVALGRGDVARRFAERSLQMDGQQYARGRQFNLALLALAHAQKGEVEEAARIGTLATEAAECLSSVRAYDYLADLANRLAKHVGLPAVREFTDRLKPAV